MANKKTAVIFGVSSQDGSYLADLLLEKDYKVVGTIRRSTTNQKENINHLLGKIKVQLADLTDSESINRVIKEAKPDEIYNFAAQSVPADSWAQPYYTGEVTGLGVLRILESVKNISPASRFYQASSREIFGNISKIKADETTPIDPNNPYGIAKAYAHLMVRCYRESYGMFAVAGILFNHESPRRGLHFVSRKVTVAVACIKNKAKNIPLDEAGEPLVDKNGKVHMGNLDAKRDWGFAKEYVEAIWKMMQQGKPEDYVIATDTSYSIKDLCRIAFEHVGLDWKDHVVSDQKFFRPTEIKESTGDFSKAKKDLDWEPKTDFKTLIEMMVDADLKRFK
ncbi:MAG TPA: GDP-mannose 4,6-dehydratase [Candidatus Saccharimonadales bacterium]|jgi:GDPmannose 4,6-dehydratase|nr:GDP-mannose 4,6-dehydratase [Candidatus Saccharimonadales bacterium]